MKHRVVHQLPTSLDGWAIVLEYDDHNWINWKLYQPTTCQQMEDGTEGNFEYWVEGATSAFPGTTDLEKAEPCAHGFQKWDGCCEFHVNGHHCCNGPESQQPLLDAIRVAMDAAADVIPPFGTGPKQFWRNP